VGRPIIDSRIYCRSPYQRNCQHRDQQGDPSRIAKQALMVPQHLQKCRFVSRAALTSGLTRTFEGRDQEISCWVLSREEAK